MEGKCCAKRRVSLDFAPFRRPPWFGAVIGTKGGHMFKIDEDLTRVLLLQDRLGTRRGAHFDHDSNAVSGPATVRNAAKDSSRKAKPGSISVTISVERDPATGELLGR